jgi:hypothetical protein
MESSVVASTDYDKADETYKPFLNNMYNPRGDGNCGFRSLAVALNMYEENSEEPDWKKVKEKMLDFPLQNMDTFYQKRWGKIDIDRALTILENREEGCISKYWYHDPTCSEIACNTFNIVIASYGQLEEEDERKAIFFLPVFHELQNMAPVILENPGGHIYNVTLTR